MARTDAKKKTIFYVFVIVVYFTASLLFITAYITGNSMFAGIG